MKIITVSVLVFFLLSVLRAVEPETPQVKRLHGLKRFLLHIAMDGQRPEACWILWNPDRKRFGECPESPKEIVELYKGRGTTETQDGILIWCHLHSVAPEDRDPNEFTEHLLWRTKHEGYMASLNKQVSELVAHCDNLGIPVWINISPENTGEFKLLTKSKKPAVPRSEWMSSEGVLIEGEIRSFDQDKETFELLRSDGKLFRDVPLSRMSKDDREYIRGLFKEQD